MFALVGVLTLLFAVLVSMLVVRVGTVALMLTGLTRDLARFEARSAFTGAGYTTSDSEKVIRHPVRRQIIMLLMMLGNIGIITVISTLIVSLINSSGEGLSGSLFFRLAIMLVGLTVLWRLAYSQWIDDQLSHMITWALKRYSNLNDRDYLGLLHLAKDFEVIEMHVEEGKWLANKTLTELRLGDEGVLVLGIERADGTYIGAPRGQRILIDGDILLVYGPRDLLSDLVTRVAGWEGDRAHEKAVERQQEIQLDEPDVEEDKATEAPRPTGQRRQGFS